MKIINGNRISDNYQVEQEWAGGGGGGGCVCVIIDISFPLGLLSHRTDRISSQAERKCLALIDS